MTLKAKYTLKAKSIMDVKVVKPIDKKEHDKGLRYNKWSDHKKRYTNKRWNKWRPWTVNKTRRRLQICWETI